jgi:hypothetical protein
MGLGPGPALRLECGPVVCRLVAQPQRLIHSRSLAMSRQFIDLSINLEKDAHIGRW